MAYWTHTVAPVGRFVEKDAGNTFEYSINDDLSMPEYYKFPHIVWVGGLVNDQGYRYATVKKTVAYIVTDEDEYGNPVIEKWNIKQNVAYQAH
tara:strand:+ start:250 stop:528 length:279 start_codon:yes stop_codon:yes gene_type:complete